MSAPAWLDEVRRLVNAGRGAYDIPPPLPGQRLLGVADAALDLLTQARAVEWSDHDGAKFCPSCHARGDVRTLIDGTVGGGTHESGCALAAAIAAMARALGVP